MLELLALVRFALPELLIDSGAWNGFYIDYHPPTVERLWRQWGQYRVYLHRIHPCKPEEALFHPHPWPSAVEIVSGKYEMTVGYGEDNTSPPVAAKIIFVEGSSYEMTDINAWHAVRPLDGSSTSLMIAGPRWNRWSPSGETKPKELDDQKRADLIGHFRHRLGYKFRALSHDMREVSRHTGEVLESYAVLAHVVKCNQCQKRLDDIYRERHLSLG